MGKTKTRKFRGSGRHGRGRKHGRGKGLRGGSGNAGLHKHKYATTVIKEAQGIEMFGHRGFKRPAGASLYDVAINVGDVADRFPGENAIDLGAHGITKLLGGGIPRGALAITVDAASAGAIEKVQKAGGKVTTTRVRKEPKPKAKEATPAAPAPKPAKETAKPAAPPAKPSKEAGKSVASPAKLDRAPPTAPR